VKTLLCEYATENLGGRRLFFPLIKINKKPLLVLQGEDRRRGLSLQLRGYIGPLGEARIGEDSGPGLRKDTILTFP